MSDHWFLIYLGFLFFLAVYYIFTFAKEIKIVQGFSSIPLLPAIGMLALIFLMPYESDSYHVLKVTFYAFATLSLAQVFESFFNNKVTLIFQGIFFLLSMVLWGLLYRATFYIYRTEQWITYVVLGSYALFFILFFAIFVKKQSFTFYFFALIAAVVVSFIHYSSLLPIFYDHSTHVILRLIGTTALMGYIIFQMLNHSAINLKYRKQISLMILLVSQILIAMSNIAVYVEK